MSVFPVLRLLDSACERKILPPTPFPIEPYQIFTRHPPSNYSTAAPSTVTSSGLSSKTKLGIGIAIPVFLLAILSLIILYWYTQRLREKGSHIESKLRIHNCQNGKGRKHTDSARAKYPIVYYPTPALHSIT